MGTRHLIAVVQNGEYKVAQYGQWDGYLDGQGKDIAKFLEQARKENKLDAFRKAVAKCSYITDEELDKAWQDAGAAPGAELVPMSVSDKLAELYPALSRDTGAKVLDIILEKNGTKLKNAIDFAGDSLFCEWAYVIDLDTDTLEIYQGFNTSKLADDERFAKAPIDNGNSRREYYPVKFLFAFNLHEVTEQDILDLDNSLRSEDEE